MAVWHEKLRVKGRLGFRSETGRTELVIERGIGEAAGLVAHFRRWEQGAGTERHRADVGSWYRLVPREAIVGQDVTSVRDRALPLLEAVEARSREELFRAELEQRPPKPPRVLEIPHETYWLTAHVFQHGVARFQIRYVAEIEGSQETGWGVGPEVCAPDGTHEDEWQTFADSLEGARIAAVEEMDAILRANRLLIKLRLIAPECP